MKFKDKINLWFNIARGYTAPNSIIPYVFAIVLAAKNYHVNYFLSFLGLIGVVLAHLSVNILDDYFDWKKGAVAEYKKLSKQGLVAANNKCFYLEQNLTTPTTVLLVALGMDFIAVLLGLYIALKVGLSVIFIAAFAGLLGFFYSAPPVRLSYRGLGEPVIGIMFGPLIMFGAYITAGAFLDELVLISSVIVGILVANIAFVHAITDFDSDTKVGKISFPILFKTKDNAIKALAMSYISAYLILGLGIYKGIYPLASVIVFITLPKALALAKLLKNDDKTKKFWMGPIENWEQLQKQGLDWFMMRLCISRNLVTDFVVLFAITYYLFR